ncbi:MAG: hypothetical protein WD971_00670, partial [Pirellulales bacterium]
EQRFPKPRVAGSSPAGGIFLNHFQQSLQLLELLGGQPISLMILPTCSVVSRSLTGRLCVLFRGANTYGEERL